MALGQMRYAQINTPLSQKLAQKKCLIAAHRGSWGGNITQNTVGAYKAALQMGADIVETDVNATTDGVLYSFHDGNEQRVFGVEKSIRQMDSKEVENYHPINTCNELTAARINRLTEVLDFLSHGELLNIDRAWNIIPQLLEVLDRYPNAKYQVVIKAPLKAKAAYEYLNAHPVKYMFMPICYSFEDVEAALSYPDLNVVGCEIIAFDEQMELFSDESIQRIHDRNLFVWVNAVTLGDVGIRPLYAKLDDDVSVLEDPSLGWGKLFEKKIDVMQTDWPALLYQYRRKILGV
mgnify:FL=1